MTDSSSPNSMITKEERTALERIAVTAKAPHSQRALCILAVDSGMSQKKAAEKSGLTPGQAKYWLKKFWSNSLEIFPEEVLKLNGKGSTAPAAEAAPKSLAEVPVIVEPASTTEKSSKKKKKKKGNKKKDKKKKGTNGQPGKSKKKKKKKNKKKKK